MKKELLNVITENSKLIDLEMQKYLSHSGEPYSVLIDSMRYSACSGGKRIRPFLTLEFCKALGGDVETALPYAVAIEMIHTYSLIHDDLPCMDDDDERRGKPTNHVKYGEATALLAGDALLTYAFKVAADNTRASNEQNLMAIKLLSENAGHHGMVGGQILDLSGEVKRLSDSEFVLMNELKTGRLIKTAVLLGCISAGYFTGSDEYSAAEAYSEKIGLAFQIEDDILDYGTEDEKTTHLTFMSIDEAKAKVDFLTSDAIKDIGIINNNETLCDFALFLANRKI